MGNFPFFNRLTADFSIGTTGGWGRGVLKKRMIGNFRVIKGPNKVMICYVSL